MIIREIEARTLLTTVKHPEGWFGVRYNMNLYRGCEHHCIYCDSRSLCYGIADFDGELLVKKNGIALLRSELAKKRTKGIVGTGSMQDPYTPSEARLNMTGQALMVLAEMDWPVHITTKSDLVLRDADLLEKIGADYACVCVTITTADNELARKLEPGAPPPSRRFAAVRELSRRGVQTGILLMPVLPDINDTEENVTTIFRLASEAGARFIVPWFGLSMRDGQREYLYRRLDQSFPGLRAVYEKRYGLQYRCESPRSESLHELFDRLRQQHGMATTAMPWKPAAAQPGLFDE